MKKILIAAMLACLFQTIAYCQNTGDVVTNAVAKLKTRLTDHEAEKAYLQFDRPYPYYVAGEIVYFKAYVTMGERHEPSTISGILHIDLIGKNNTVIQSKGVELVSGTGWGDFQLPDTLQKGSYRVRAYTQWMRNDKNPCFFDQFISVYSTAGDNSASTVKHSSKPDIQFFPEGGNLVVDVPAKVGFKAIGTNGLGLNAQGIVVDDQNKEIAKIKTNFLGMGAFNFIPEQGRSYKANITFGNGTKTSVNLPAVEAKGITLSVNNTDDPSKVSVMIRSNRDYYKENQGKQLELLVYHTGLLKRYRPKLESEVLGLDLPASAFPTGVLQITLLSETGEPLSERLTFIQNPDLLNLQVTANKQAFAKRENVQLNLNAKDKTGKPVNGSFSVSVVDESKILVDENSENSILSYFLLASELKGYIEKPNYYFTNTGKDARTDLDALMLTQGYRRFTWKELEGPGAETAANTFSPEKGIDISGVLKTKSGAPIANCALTLLPQNGGALQTGITDNDGRFRFTNVPGGTRLILKTMSPAGKKGILTLDPSAAAPPPSAGELTETEYNANADILASFQNSEQHGLITASTGSTSLLIKEGNTINSVAGDNYRSSSLGGSGHANQVIKSDKLQNSPSLSLALTGIAHGVQFLGGVPSLKTGMTISQGNETLIPMLIVVDGVEIGRGASIDEYNPNSVETVEILDGANAAIYGLEGGEGVMVITTKMTSEKADAVSKEMAPGIFSVEPKGFYKALEFYSPRYDAAQPANNQPDQRITVFWKPDVTTDADGNASFNFFNADGTGTYRVEVEGIDSKGNLGRQVFRYKVQ